MSTFYGLVQIEVAFLYNENFADFCCKINCKMIH